MARDEGDVAEPSGLPEGLAGRDPSTRSEPDRAAAEGRPSPRFPTERRVRGRLFYRATLSAVTVAWCVGLAVSGRLPGLFAVAALFALQQGALSLRAARWLRVQPFAVADRAFVRDTVAALADRAGVPAPEIVYRDVGIAAAVRYKKGVTQLIVSPSFAGNVTPGSLRCILAHEMAHVAAGDTRDPRRYAPPVAALVGYALLLVWVSRLDFFLFAPLVWAFTVPYVHVVARLTGVVSRGREARADRGGAYLVGDAPAMARALGETRDWATRVRRAVFGPPAVAWVFAPASLPTTSHPSLARRIADMEAYVVPAGRPEADET